MAEQRPRRVCDICGQIDTAPRHVVGFAPSEAPAPDQALITAVLGTSETDEVKAAAIAELSDTTLRSAHLDCCRDSGTCSDGSCAAIHQTYDGADKQNNALVKYIESGAVDHVGAELNAARIREWERNVQQEATK